MILEWFFSMILGLLTALASLLPATDDLVIPDLGPLFGMMRSLDAATSGVITETFTVATVLLSILVLLFMYGIIRQVISHLPFVGGR